MDKTKLPTISEFIAASEGFSSKPYKCTAGYLTIGYGRNLDSVGIRKEELLHFANKYGVDQDEDAVFARVCLGIDKTDAGIMLNNDITNAKSEIRKFLPYFSQLPSHIQYVLIDMVFNLGINGLKKFRAMISSIGAYYVQGKPQSLDEAALEMLHSQYTLQVKTRAVRNAKLLANDFERVKKLLAVRPKTSEHMKVINTYGGK